MVKPVEHPAVRTHPPEDRAVVIAAARAELRKFAEMLNPKWVIGKVTQNYLKKYEIIRSSVNGKYTQRSEIV